MSLHVSQRIPYASSSSSDRQLHAAIAEGDLCCVTRLLHNGASVNCYLDGLTPVAQAIVHKQANIAQELLNQRPDVHQGKRLYPRASNTTSRIPVPSSEKQGLHEPLLMLAIINGMPDIANQLLKLGADINAAEDLNHQTSLHAAVRTGQSDMVDLLLDQDPNVNRLDLQSRAPLHLAVASGHVGIATSLLDSGASGNLSGPLDLTALHVACQRGDAAMVKLLLNHGSVVNARDGCQMTPLHHACAAGNLEIVQALLQRRANEWDVDDMHDLPLHKALDQGHLCVVEALLDHAKVQGLFQCQGHLWTSLANQEGGQEPLKRLPLQSAVAKGDSELVLLLLKHGAHVNSCDSVYGDSALHWAARRGDEAMVHLLLENGGDVSLISRSEGASLLHVSCLSAKQGEALSVGQLLLAQGADVNVCPTWGVHCEPVLHTAVHSGREDWVRMLLAAPGVQLDACSLTGDTALRQAIRGHHVTISQLLVEAGCSINSQDGSNNSLLYAIACGAYSAASLLLQHGACLPSLGADAASENPLQLLLRNEPPESIAASPEQLRLVALLVCAGVAVGSLEDPLSPLSQAQRTAGCEKLLSVMGSNAPGTPTSLFRSSIKKVRQQIQSNQQTCSLCPLVNKLPIPVVLKEYVSFQLY